MKTSVELTVQELDVRAIQAKSWMMQALFPLWSEQGVLENGLFADHLTLQHRYKPTKTSRVRVQARQTYVFAVACELGWEPCFSARLVRDGVETLSKVARCSRGTVGHLLSMQDIRLTGRESNLYDTAFVLFALAHAHRVIGLSLEPAYEILVALDRSFRDHENGGYLETFPRPGYRDQNPHMHMLEACHALYQADGNRVHLTREAEIVDLFKAHMINHPSGTLCERFALDWRPRHVHGDNVIEPGHQFEWVWLLGQDAALSGSPLLDSVVHLYEMACRTLDSLGRVSQRVHRNGRRVDPSRRTWQQTDALKAHLMMFERTYEPIYAQRAVQSFDILMDEFLTPEGGWIDHLDQHGNALVDSMTAATGYHVVLAFRELMRVTDTS